MDYFRFDDRGENSEDDLVAHTITCFSVVVSHWGGGTRPRGEEECRRLFSLLNLDLSGALGQLTPTQAALARLQAHIGQPVSLPNASASGVTVLRMVLGARFFSIVAHAGPGSVNAALESEIADAVRALEKLELLAQMWHKAKDICFLNCLPHPTELRKKKQRHKRRKDIDAHEIGMGFHANPEIFPNEF